MSYEKFTTLNVQVEKAVAWVTFDYPPVNIQGLPMLAELNVLADALEQNRGVKVVVFQSAHPEIFVAHADTNFLKDMSTTAVSHEEVELLNLQTTLERISNLPQATIAKIEGFARKRLTGCTKLRAERRRSSASRRQTKVACRTTWTTNATGTTLSSKFRRSSDEREREQEVPRASRSPAAEIPVEPEPRDNGVMPVLSGPTRVRAK